MKIVSTVLAVLTFMLIVWGGHVNTTKSGMAFPDWPTSNASPMITYSPAKWLWEGDKFWEHGHRLFASLVGLGASILLVVAYRATPRAQRPHKAVIGATALIFTVVATSLVGLNSMPVGFMEAFMMLMAILAGASYVTAIRKPTIRTLWLSIAAFCMVILQGAFGGYTVRNNLPDWTSTAHGMFAEVFFITVLGIVFLASKRNEQSPAISSTARNLIAATWVVTFVQFFLGALTRHTDAWVVSATFPGWTPSSFFPSAEAFQSTMVVVHFVHRTFAYAVAALVVGQWLIIRKQQRTGAIQRLSAVAVLAVVVQIVLGAAILWTARGEVVTTLHVMTGVALLALNTLILFNGLQSPMSEGVAQQQQSSIAEGVA